MQIICLKTAVKDNSDKCEEKSLENHKIQICLPVFIIIIINC